ncbi:MAG: hypothetical protein KTR31_29195, partial [Myxococcales bacterium]|nr:hypothetical protein [Myxococcales bacterium]
MCLLRALILVSIATLTFSTPASAADPPSRLTLDTAEYHLKNFQEQVSNAKGRPIKMSESGKEALKRIKSLMRSHPDHPRVIELFDQAKAALRLSKGKTFEITD